MSSPTPNKNFSAIPQAIRILGNSAPSVWLRGWPIRPSSVPRAMARARSFGWDMFPTQRRRRSTSVRAASFVLLYYEGFGIPPFEAMSCGCPALARTAPAVREVCGDVPLYFDPRRPEEFALRLREVFADPALRARMSSNGLERARLSWMQSVRFNLQTA